MATVSTRKQIRAAVVAWLTTKVPAVASRVFGNRSAKIWDTEFPLLVVFTKNETAEEWVKAPREFKKTLRLAIDVMVNQNDPDQDSPPGSISGDDELDDICEVVEQAMANFGSDPTLLSLVNDIIYTDTEIDHSVESEKPFLVARITFDVSYFDLAPKETEGLDDFENANIEMKLKGSTPQTVPAVDTVTLPTS